MLPGIDIEFQNGNLQLVEPSADGIFAVVASVNPDECDLTLGVPVAVRSMLDVVALGILDDVDHHFLYEFFDAFYKIAEPGNKVWIFPIARNKTISSVFEIGLNGKSLIEDLLDIANGEVSGLFTVWNPDNTVELEDQDGLDADVWKTRSAAQTCLENYLSTKKVPIWAVVEGYGFSGIHSDLVDLNEGTTDRVQIFIGSTEEDTKNQSLGGYAGRLAVCKVSQNPGRKKFGEVHYSQCWIKNTKVEQYDITSIHSKGYVTFRTHPKTSGYYITDCPMACDVTTDYGKLTRRRTIDKAYVLAYAEASKEILEDFNLTPAGTIDPIYAGLLESNLKDVIYNSMTLNGELSADPQNDLDKGCEFKIDLNYPTGSTGQIKFSVAQVRVRGYAEMITIPLGFAPFNS